MCRPFICPSGHHCPEGLTCMLVFAIFSAVLGMFQFGFNTGVINAPKDILNNFIADVWRSRTGNFIESFEMDLIWGTTVSIFAVGGMIGGFIGGTIADWCGRKCGLLLNNAIAILAATLMSSSQLFKSIECLIVGRFFIGLNCGLNTHLVPMYLSEIAPMNLRGALGTVSQLGVTIGLLLSQVLGLSDILGTSDGWPFLLGVAFVPAVLQLMLLPMCPESPRYLLITKGRVSEARYALTRLRCTSDVDEDIEEMRMEESRATSSASNHQHQLQVGEQSNHLQPHLRQRQQPSRRKTSSNDVRHPLTSTTPPSYGNGAGSTSFLYHASPSSPSHQSPAHPHHVHYQPGTQRLQHSYNHHQQQHAMSPDSPSPFNVPVVEKTSFWDLISKSNLRRPLIVAVVIQLSQQLSGINAIFYYSTDLFEDAGLENEQARYATLGVGAVMVIMTLVSIPLMDKMGRRTLHLWGLGGMFIASIFFTIALLVRFIYQAMTFVSIVSSLLFVVFFAVGPGSIPWLITAELFSQGPRPTAMSIAVFVNWSANLAVGFLFPIMKRYFENYVFLPFTVLLAIFWTYTYRNVPETKNRTFEEISALFRRAESMESFEQAQGSRKSVQSDVVYGDGIPPGNGGIPVTPTTVIAPPPNGQTYQPHMMHSLQHHPQAVIMGQPSQPLPPDMPIGYHSHHDPPTFVGPPVVGLPSSTILPPTVDPNEPSTLLTLPPPPSTVTPSICSSDSFPGPVGFLPKAESESDLSV